MKQKTESKDPKQDWGFYAVTPRIVRTLYKDLSHTEKWLYTCLKDLCGDKGSCFRSLRSLSEETDISIASLSKMIPHLHKSGLIHAEKKKRSASGKEVWHISIIDIWAENAKHCKDCSKNEQLKEEIVQNLNELHNDCSNSEQGCSNSEQNSSDCSNSEQTPELGCSNFRYRRINSKNTNSEEYKYEEENIPPNEPNASTLVANATTPSVLSSENLEQEKSTESTKWCAEAIVQIVEMKRNKRFLEDTRGKSQKSQRERQLDAAKKIIAAKITQEEFIRAYDARNDAWWQENQGELTVVEMAANTKNKVMRTLEVLENLEKKSSKPPQQKVTERSHHGTASHDGYTKEERLALYKMTQEERKMYNQKRREAREAQARSMEVL